MQHDGAPPLEHRAQLLGPARRCHADGEAGQRGHGRRGGCGSCRHIRHRRTQLVGATGPGRPQVDQVRDDDARQVERDKGPERRAARLRREERLPEGQVDEQAAERADRADDADRRAGQRRARISCVVRSPPFAIAASALPRKIAGINRPVATAEHRHRERVGQPQHGPHQRRHRHEEELPCRVDAVLGPHEQDHHRPKRPHGEPDVLGDDGEQQVAVGDPAARALPEAVVLGSHSSIQ